MGRIENEIQDGILKNIRWKLEDSITQNISLSIRVQFNFLFLNNIEETMITEIKEQINPIV